MLHKETLKVLKEIDEKQKRKERAKLGLYLTPNHVFSYHGFTDFIYTAVRGVGKTVIAMETAIILKEKYGYENVKVYYFRLTDLSIKALLSNNAREAVDPYLIDKYDLNITKRGNMVYNKGKPLFEAFALTSAGSKGKGINLYDCNWFKGDKKRFIVTIWDEFLMAEGVEKRSIGDPVSQYKIYREAIYRDAEVPKDYDAVYNFLLANNVSECAAVTGAMYNYIPNPENHRRVKLTRKHAMFWNVPITEAYLDKRSRSVNSNIMDYENDPNYAAVEKDLSLIKPKKTRIRRVSAVIMFDNYDKGKWFCLYDGKYIKKYNNETVRKNLYLPMKRHLDALFNQETVANIFEIYDTRGFMYTDLISMSTFQSQMKLLKNK